MNKRQLGNSDLWITTIGFGAWAIGGTGYEYAWGPQNDQDSIATIHRALEMGINWIDTAPGYGKGHSEDIVARAVADWSGSRPYIFTKCGLHWDSEGKLFKVLDGQAIRQECEESLRRLRVDAIDLYQIHWPTDDPVDIDHSWDALAQLQRQGKVRWIGVSNFNVEQMQQAQEIAPITSLQPPYSLLRRKVEVEIFPFCQRTGIGVIVYSPMYSGLLTGAMTHKRAASLPEDDWRGRDPEFNEPRLSMNLRLVERLKDIGDHYGRNPGEVAVAWSLRHPAVTGAIVGARSVKQVEGVMRAGDLKLSEADAAELESIIPS